MTEPQRGFVLVALTFSLALAPRWLGFRWASFFAAVCSFSFWHSAYLPSSSLVGTKSNPMQNLGGIGLSSRSSFADVDGLVNGSGTCPPRSAVEQETVKNPASRIRCR